MEEKGVSKNVLRGERSEGEGVGEEESNVDGEKEKRPIQITE